MRTIRTVMTVRALACIGLSAAVVSGCASAESSADTGIDVDNGDGSAGDADAGDATTDAPDDDASAEDATGDADVADATDDSAADADGASDTTDADASDPDALDASDAADSADSADSGDSADGADSAHDGDGSDSADAADTDAGDVTPVTPTVTWCRLQFPTVLSRVAGSPIAFYGRVFAGGITDRTAGTDEDVRLLAQLGFGPRDSTPTGDWEWTDADPNIGWNDAAERGNDEYIATVGVPGPGEFDYAFRFAVGGQDWVYCDRNAGFGSDGAQDGYQPANAGKLSAADVCDGDACGPAAAPSCSDDTTRLVYSTPTCLGDDGTGLPLCDEPDPIEEPCADGLSCVEGACVDTSLRPTWCRIQFPSEIEAIEGEVWTLYARVFADGVTTLTSGFDPNDNLTGEIGWGPVGSTPDDTWTWSAGTGNSAWNDATDIGNDEYLADIEVPAPGEYDFAWRFAGERGEWLYCDTNAGPGSDGAEDGYQSDNAGRLTSLEFCDVAACDPAPPATCADLTSRLVRADGVCVGPNPDGGAICEYPEAVEPCAAGEVCTQGRCVPDTVESIWCRLQFPTSMTLNEGGTSVVYGRMYAAGLTDRTGAIDPHPSIRAELAVGPDGTNPTVSTDGWTFFEAAPNAAWDAGLRGEPGNDEYQATLTAGMAGTYDYAFRFSGDSGATWVWCDVDRGGASDGAEDGYSPADSGHLVVLSGDPPNPCDADPCVTPEPPTCAADGRAVIAPTGAALCVPGVEGNYACEYETERIACSTREQCIDGACAVVNPLPAPAQLRITEVLARTSQADPTSGAWVEVLNRTADPILLDGCTLDVNAVRSAFPEGTLVAGGGRATFASVASPTTLGFVPTAVLPGLDLTAASNTLAVRCGETVIDTVTFEQADAGTDAAAQLDPTYESTAVASLSSLGWCGATSTYGSLGRRGTPGVANTACGFGTPWCRLQFPASIDTTAGSDVTAYVRIFVAGLTDRTLEVDPDRYVVVEVGFGADGSTPSSGGWTWTSSVPNVGWNGAAWGEIPNDEYQATFTMPAPGTYDYAFRVSTNGGVGWTYCDRSLGVGQDGAENGYQPANSGSLVSR